MSKRLLVAEQLNNQQMDLMVSGKTCGTCEFIRPGECIITRHNRRKITQGSVACNDYAEDLSLEPMKIMTLKEMGFESDPKAGDSLQSLGFRDTTIEIGE